MKRTLLLRKTPLRPMSKRRQKESRIYSERRKAFLAEHPLCEICGVRPASEVHHRLKRGGAKYLDETTWMALCGGPLHPNGCHQWIHRNPRLAREMGYLA